MCYGHQPLNDTTRHPRHCSSGIHPLQHSHEACSREGGKWESSFWGMLKKAASGVLALFPCSRTESTLRASKGLRPCWTDFFNHSPPLLTSIVCRAFTCHRREIFNKPIFEFPDYTSGEFLNKKIGVRLTGQRGCLLRVGIAQRHARYLLWPVKRLAAGTWGWL